MATYLDEFELAELAMNLCARYFLHPATGEILGRTGFLTTPQKMAEFIGTVKGMRGAAKAASALKWVLPNSGSPQETKMALQYRTPLRHGGMGLRFDAMNYDVKAGRLVPIMSQSTFSIDMVDVASKIGMEYDGSDYHTDAATEKQRRNSLAALGWTILPIGNDVLGSSQRTVEFGRQVAHLMNKRLRFPNDWEGRYIKLRKQLDLPV